MFLATTALSEFWDVQDEVLFLGPWCIPYSRRKDWQSLKFVVSENPWNNRERLTRAIAYTSAVRAHLLTELAAYLNEVHQVHHDKRYWNILLGAWLLYYVPDLYSRYISIKEAVGRYPNLRTLRLDPQQYHTPLDVSEYVNLYCSDHYPFQLYSQILESIGLGDIKRFEGQHDTVWNSIKRGAGSRPRGRFSLRERQKSLLGKVGAFQDVLFSGLYFGKVSMFRLVWGLRFRAGPVCVSAPNFLTLHSEGLDHRRPAMAKIRTRDEFEQIVVASLSRNFPALYLEHYSAMRDYCVRRIRRVPKVAMSGVGWVFDEPFKFVAAEASARGARLLGVQHGAAYGVARTLPWLDWELSITDRWYAWGWSSLTDHPKIGDLPSPMLAAVGGRYSGKAKDIVYVTTDADIHLQKLQYVPLGSQFEEYLAWQVSFLRTVTKELLGKVVVQLYPKDTGWNQRERLNDYIAGLRFNTHGRRFANHLGRARVVVIDHVGTATLEALFSGVPCVLFWNSSHWECRDEAEPYLERLRQAGILFHDPIMAAHQVCGIYDRPLEWWNSDQVREAREAFVECFALTRRDWPRYWIRELLQVIALSERIRSEVRS